MFNFYPYLQRFITPQQRDVTLVLQAAAHATHDLVPPEVKDEHFSISCRARKGPASSFYLLIVFLWEIHSDRGHSGEFIAYFSF